MTKYRSVIHGCIHCLVMATLFLLLPDGLISRAFASSDFDLTELSIEELMNVNVTSVSKKSQPVSEAAAAVFVITREDIRRSGATTIADALRMAPGVQVARIDANKWAITARGSNGRFANKLLVLMDGRSVNKPVYSGFFMDNIDTVLEDIDRIEVIRGPGASLWGANAVNGVINIITKSADITQGGLVTASAGTEEIGKVSLRYGSQIGNDTPFRVYVRGFKRDAGVDSQGEETEDDWHYLRGGFRMDHQGSSRDRFTLQGDIFNGTYGETISEPVITPPYSNTYNHDSKEKGGNLLARWTRSLSGSTEFSLQTFYDRSEHELHLGRVDVDTFDTEFQHRFPLGAYHDITWGAGYRVYKDDFKVNPDLVSINPSKRSISIFNAFLQDEIGFFDKRLLLTLGSKFEYNDYSRFEVQPNARLLWKPDEIHSIWLSVARAVRAPARVEKEASVLLSVIPPSSMGQLPIAVDFKGSDDFGSEKLTAYEFGYRVQPTSSLALDAALYYNEYKDLRTTINSTPVPADFPPTYMIVTSTCTNDTRGKVYGFELASEWHAAHWIHFRPAYTYMENKIDYNPTDILALQDPRHQISLRASLDLPRNFKCDMWYRYVDRISSAIGGYDTMDARVAWKCARNLEISIVGQNLLDSHHAEFQPEALHTVGTEVQRGVYGKVVCTFD